MRSLNSDLQQLMYWHLQIVWNCVFGVGNVEGFLISEIIWDDISSHYEISNSGLKQLEYWQVQIVLNNL